MADLRMTWRATFLHVDSADDTPSQRRCASASPGREGGHRSSALFQVEQLYVEALPERLKESFGGAGVPCPAVGSCVATSNGLSADLSRDTAPAGSSVRIQDGDAKVKATVKCERFMSASTVSTACESSLTADSSSDSTSPAPSRLRQRVSSKEQSWSQIGQWSRPTEDIRPNHHQSLMPDLGPARGGGRGGSTKADFFDGLESHVQNVCRYEGPHSNADDDYEGAIINGPYTTVMLRNIPCRVTQEMLCDKLVLEGFGGSYDFLHLPKPMRMAPSKGNLGYGFINFVSAECAARFVESFTGVHFAEQSCSDKVIEVRPARLQGRTANLNQFGSKIRRSNALAWNAANSR